MCGINGIFSYHYAANPVDVDELVRTRDHMTARGPDGAGAWLTTDRRAGLGHRRLSIIDLTAGGAQPMLSSDGRYVVTFNGEIYNFRELRRVLENEGHVFRSNSDTEVLLALYAARGATMVGDLRGMFAFAIFDNLARTLFLARDPYGIKPLYYADDGWTLRFASQVKSLLAGGAVSRDTDPAAAVGFYLFGSVPEPFTTVTAIRALPAGTTLTVDVGGPSAPRRYHRIADTYAAAEPRDLASAGAQADVRSALLESVICHLTADVPVGAFLSAGVDSGALVGLMRDAGAGDIKTTTVAFEEFRGRPEDESPIAREIAQRYGTDHVTRIVSKVEFEADLPKIVEAMDQPSIDGVNTWFVAKAARERGLKVAISGLGGDELMGGYPSFRDVPKWVRVFGPARFLPGLGTAVRHLARPLTSVLGLSPKAASLVELASTWEGAYLLRRGLFMPWELDRVLKRDVVREGLRRLRPMSLVRAELGGRHRTDFARVATLESSLYMRNQLLRDTDWASMAHSLEVRVPLVDSTLLSRLAPYAGPKLARMGKSLLANAPSHPLPSAIVDRPKTGFTTPIRDWMEDLAPRPLKDARRPAGRDDRAWARGWSAFVAQRALPA